MNIAEYLRETGLTQEEFAARVGVTQGRVSQWIAGERVSAERVLRIEQATQGQVSRYELRPDVYGDTPERQVA